MKNNGNANYDIIVIGSGIGGLTFASLMAQLQHKRVLVLERHFKLGGFTHAFSRPGGYTWDVGLHYVGSMGKGEMGRQLFDLVTGGTVEWAKMPSPFERFVYPDFTFAVPDDRKAYEQALINKFPSERSAIRQYFKDLAKLNQWFARYTLMKAGTSPLITIPMRLVTAPDQLALMTTGAYLDQRFGDPQLKALLASQWGDYGLPPGKSALIIHALIAAHYLDGAYYPVGGAGVIAQSVVPMIEAHGGRTLVNHRVCEIIVREGQAVGVQVEVQQGRAHRTTEFYAPLIVSDAGAYNTYCRLLPASLPLPFRPELEAMASPHSVVTLYLGLQENPKKLGFYGENHWLYAGYDHDEAFRRSSELLDGKPTTCYLSFPSLKDPQAKGHTAEIIANLDYAAVAHWQAQPWRKRDEDYQAMKARISEALLNFVEARYPGFRQLVAYTELSTPLTIEHFTGHKNGGIYGLPATPERFRAQWLKPQTPIKNLLLTGADVTSLGIMGAMMGGVATAASVLGSFGLFQIIKAAKVTKFAPQPQLERAAA